MREKVGRTIRTRIAWSGVPRGTEGKVIEVDGKLLMIEWKLPGRDKPLVDWFTEAEYAGFLEEV